MDRRRSLLSSIPSDLSKAALNYLVQRTYSYASSSSSTYAPRSIESPATDWIIDSGASHHATFSSFFLTDRSKTPPIRQMQTADGSFKEVKQMGCIRTPNLSISDVLHVPGFSVNLLSVSKLTQQGYDIVFSSDGCDIRERRSKEIVGNGRRIGGVYVLTYLHLISSSPLSSNDSKTITAIYKLILHCGTCAEIITRFVRRLPGVEGVKAYTESDRLVVTGKLNPVSLQARIQLSIQREVVLISPRDVDGYTQHVLEEWDRHTLFHLFLASLSSD